MTATPRLDAVRAHLAGDVDALLALVVDLLAVAPPRRPADWPRPSTTADRLALVARSCASGAPAGLPTRVVRDRAGRIIPPPPTRTGDNAR